MPLNNDLLDILACPKCKGEIEYKEADNQLVCSACRLIYMVKDGIPVMLVDEAKTY